MALIDFQVVHAKMQPIPLQAVRGLGARRPERVAAAFSKSALDRGEVVGVGLGHREHPRVAGDDGNAAHSGSRDQIAVARIAVTGIRDDPRSLQRNPHPDRHDARSGRAHRRPEPLIWQVAAKIGPARDAALLHGDRQFPRGHRRNEQRPGFLIASDGDQRVLRQRTLVARQPV